MDVRPEDSPAHASENPGALMGPGACWLLSGVLVALCGVVIVVAVLQSGV